MSEVHFMPGEHIERSAQKLIAAGVGAWGMFNDIRLENLADDTAEKIVSRFEAETSARLEAYRASPEGIEAEHQRQQSIADNQAIHDRLMIELPSLNWSDDIAVLDWLCAMQKPSDHVGVTVSRKEILAAFREHGFVAGVNCGADFRAEDRENVFRYLVGQAMSGLEVIAIHGIIHKFAEDWKVKFARGFS